jgi:kinesin family protein 5
MCRFRPLNDNEKRSNSNVIAKFPTDDEENTVIFASKPYIYDKVFRPETTQENVYNACAKEIVEGKPIRQEPKQMCKKLTTRN